MVSTPQPNISARVAILISIHDIPDLINYKPVGATSVTLHVVLILDLLDSILELNVGQRAVTEGLLALLGDGMMGKDCKFFL